jgi:hypothetical protein
VVGRQGNPDAGRYMFRSAIWNDVHQGFHDPDDFFFRLDNVSVALAKDSKLIAAQSSCNV